MVKGSKGLEEPYHQHYYSKAKKCSRDIRYAQYINTNVPTKNQ